MVCARTRRGLVVGWLDRRIRPLIVLNQQVMRLSIVRLEAARLRYRAGICMDGSGFALEARPSSLLQDLVRALAHRLMVVHLRLLVLLHGGLLTVLELLAVQRMDEAGVLADLAGAVPPGHVEERVL